MVDKSEKLSKYCGRIIIDVYVVEKKIGIDEPKFKVLKTPIKEPLLGSAKERLSFPWTHLHFRSYSPYTY